MKKLAICSACVLLVACQETVIPAAKQQLSSVNSQSASSIAFTSISLIGPGDTILPIQVEIADDAAEQAQGLMFRESLSKNHGMLFVFNDAAERSFWMKNTLIPLDVLYFDADGRFVSVQTMQPCTTHECPSYPSNGAAWYALEMNAGFAAEYGIGDGWVLEQ